MEITKIIEELLNKSKLFGSSLEQIEATKLAIKLLKAKDLQGTINSIIFNSTKDEDSALKVNVLRSLIKINFLKIHQYTKEWWINKCSTDWGK